MGRLINMLDEGKIIIPMSLFKHFYFFTDMVEGLTQKRRKRGKRGAGDFELDETSSETLREMARFLKEKMDEQIRKY